MLLKKQFKNLLCLLLLSAVSFGIAAQNVIKGVILDGSTDEPLIGANVIIKGTSTGTATDFDGNFSLDVGPTLPTTLEVTYTGFASKEISVNNTDPITISLQAAGLMMNQVTISASRIEEKVLESSVSIEKLDPIAIKQTAAPDYFDAITNLKGVQSTKGSLTFNAINTRGFGAVANERFVMLMDGMDNAAPLLNFPTGGIMGPSELDIHSVELVPGAASALYGPNAFNGILLTRSKNPFDYTGLSAQVKYGVNTSDADDANPYYQASIRYAHKFNDNFAIKANFSYLKGNDWRANDYNTGRLGAGIPTASTFGAPNFDGLNKYGDEAQIVVPLVALAGNLAAGIAPNIPGVDAAMLTPLIQQLGLSPYGTLDLRRTGFNEEDLLESNEASNVKGDFSLNYNFDDGGELSYAYRIGNGNTVYQGGERYILRDFKQQFHKLEYTNGGLMARAYLSDSDAGKSYNLSALGAFLNEGFAPSASQWVPTYAGVYTGALLQAIQLNPANIGNLTPEIANQAHQAARAAADAGIPAVGSTEYNSAVEAVRDRFFKRTPPGAGFIDDSKLYHAELTYNFADQIDVVDILVGGNFRQYNLFTDGTVFNEDPENTGSNERIKINEYGAFVQLTKALLPEERLKLQGSIRYDKNENFEGRVTPKLSAVYSAGARREHNFRASIQTGFRNPATQAQYIYFPSSAGTIVGGTESNAGRYGIYNGGAYTASSYNAFVASQLAGAPNPALLETANLEYVKPEKLRAFEIGYKGIISNKLFLDVNYYNNNYKDFITILTVRSKEAVTVGGVEIPAFSPYRPYTNASGEINSYGFGFNTRYKINNNWAVYGNYSYTTFSLDGTPDGFEAGFNMPENIFVIGLANRKLTKNLGFDINYRWQEEFFWENSFAYGTIPSYGTLNAQFNYQLPKINSSIKIGGTNLFGNDYRTNAGGPYIGQQYYLAYTYGL